MRFEFKLEVSSWVRILLPAFVNTKLGEILLNWKCTHHLFQVKMIFFSLSGNNSKHLKRDEWFSAVPYDWRCCWSIGIAPNAPDYIGLYIARLHAIVVMSHLHKRNVCILTCIQLSRMIFFEASLSEDLHITCMVYTKESKIMQFEVVTELVSSSSMSLNC